MVDYSKWDNFQVSEEEEEEEEEEQDLTDSESEKSRMSSNSEDYVDADEEQEDILQNKFKQTMKLNEKNNSIGVTAATAAAAVALTSKAATTGKLITAGGKVAAAKVGGMVGAVSPSPATVSPVPITTTSPLSTATGGITAAAAAAAAGKDKKVFKMHQPKHVLNDTQKENDKKNCNHGVPVSNADLVQIENSSDSLVIGGNVNLNPLQQCACCLKMISATDNSTENETVLESTSKPQTEVCNPFPTLITQHFDGLKSHPNCNARKIFTKSRSKMKACALIMPVLSFQMDEERLGEDLPQMQEERPFLNPSYAGSAIQRMQYSEAWRIHGPFFENHPRLKFDPKIHIHIKDHISDIHPLFFTDPLFFSPKPSLKFNPWGIQDVYLDFIAFNMRRLNIKGLYGENARYGSADIVEDEPEVQFVKCLAYLKEKEIWAYRQSVPVSYIPQPVMKKQIPHDYIIEVSLDFLPRIWRRIKVSSATPLSCLHDKILAPLMGWVRNYHAHFFTEQKSGAMFGSYSSAAPDMINLPAKGFYLMDDTEFYLGDVLRQKGDKCLYTYDMQNCYQHTLALFEIVSFKESDGKCLVLDGEMAPIPEDSIGTPGIKGPQGYQELLNIYDILSIKKRIKLQHTISEALNYLKRPAFRPYHFSTEDCQKDLNRAFASRNSIPDGPKTVFYPDDESISDNNLAQLEGVSEESDYMGCRVMTRWIKNESCYLRETISGRRDRRSVGLCSCCASPNNLQSCNNCKMVWYCSKECQRNMWAKHQLKCTNQTEYRAQVLERRKSHVTKGR